jgi:hypothetical protein
VRILLDYCQVSVIRNRFELNQENCFPHQGRIKPMNAPQ